MLGATAGLDVTLSHGLGRRVAASDLPLSRQGAAPDFTTLAATARVGAMTAQGLRLALVARGHPAPPEVRCFDGRTGVYLQGLPHASRRRADR